MKFNYLLYSVSFLFILTIYNPSSIYEFFYFTFIFIFCVYILIIHPCIVFIIYARYLFLLLINSFSLSINIPILTHANPVLYESHTYKIPIFLATNSLEPSATHNRGDSAQAITSHSYNKYCSHPSHKHPFYSYFIKFDDLNIYIENQITQSSPSDLIKTPAEASTSHSYNKHCSHPSHKHPFFSYFIKFDDSNIYIENLITQSPPSVLIETSAEVSTNHTYNKYCPHPSHKHSFHWYFYRFDDVNYLVNKIFSSSATPDHTHVSTDTISKLNVNRKCTPPINTANFQKLINYLSTLHHFLFSK